MYEKLDKLHTHINDLIKYAEAKNFALLAFNGIVIVEIVKHWLDIEAHCYSWLDYVFIYVLALNVVSFIISMSSLLPTQRSSHIMMPVAEDTNPNLLYFGYIASLTPEKYFADLQDRYGITTNNTPLCMDFISQIIIQSQILISKLNRFKLASMVSFCAFTTPIGYYIYTLLLSKK